MQWDSLHQAQIFIWSSRLTWQQHFRPCTLGNAPQPPVFCHTPGTPCCLHTQNVRLLRTRWAASEERDQEGKRYNRFSAPPSKLLSSLGLTEKDKAQARAIPSLLSPTRNTSCVQRNHWDPQEVNTSFPCFLYLYYYSSVLHFLKTLLESTFTTGEEGFVSSTSVKQPTDKTATEASLSCASWEICPWQCSTQHIPTHRPINY